METLTTPLMNPSGSPLQVDRILKDDQRVLISCTILQRHIACHPSNGDDGEEEVMKLLVGEIASNMVPLMTLF